MPAFYKEWLYRAKINLTGKMIMKPQPRAMLYSGPDSCLEIAKVIGQLGLKNTLVVTDKPLRDLGLIDPTIQALENAGVKSTIFDGVTPDPTQQVVDSGLEMLRKESCDNVLAFGGGSSIDSAKVIALAAGNNCQAKDCIGFNVAKSAALPLFAIPTTAGTGSEATFIAVVSDNESHQKGAVIDPRLIPKAAALDPKLMTGLPASITAATGMDALTHAIESYIGVFQTEDTDFFGLAATRLIFDNIEEAYSNGENLAAREAMALGSYYGGLAITNALVGYVHAFSHNLGARYGIPHGLGNAMVLPHVLEMVRDSAASKLADIAVYNGMGDRSEGDAALAQKLIDRIWALNEAIGIPRSTDQIQEQDIPALADAALKEGSGYPTPRFFERKEALDLLNKLRAA